MRQKLVQLFLLFIILVVACKKEKVLEPEIVPPPTTLIEGLFTHSIFKQVQSDTLQTFLLDTVSAKFPFANDSGFVKVDSVIINSKSLPVKKGLYSGRIPTASSYTWRIKGKNGIPDVEYSNAGDVPFYGGYALLPDSIDRSKGVKIAIAGVTNSKKGSILILDNWSSHVIKQFDANTSSLTFSAPEFIGMGVNQSSVTLRVTLYNEVIKEFNGKKFKFTNEFQLTKQVPIY